MNQSHILKREPLLDTDITNPSAGTMCPTGKTADFERLACHDIICPAGHRVNAVHMYETSVPPAHGVFTPGADPVDVYPWCVPCNNGKTTSPQDLNTVRFQCANNTCVPGKYYSGNTLSQPSECTDCPSGRFQLLPRQTLCSSARDCAPTTSDFGIKGAEKVGRDGVPLCI